MRHYWGTHEATGEPTAIFDTNTFLPLLQQQKQQQQKVHYDNQHSKQGGVDNVNNVDNPHDLDSLNHLKDSIFWPSNGISIVYSSSSTTGGSSSSTRSSGSNGSGKQQIHIKSLVLGQLVQKFDEKTKAANILDGADGALAFSEYGNVFMMIENPQNPPNSWVVTPYIIPGTIRGVGGGSGDSTGTKTGGGSGNDSGANSNTQKSDIKDETNSNVNMNTNTLESSTVPIYPVYRWTSMAASSGKPYVLQHEYVYLVGLRTHGDRDSGTIDRDSGTIPPIAYEEYHVLGRLSAIDIGTYSFGRIEILVKMNNKPAWFYYPQTNTHTTQHNPIPNPNPSTHTIPTPEDATYNTYNTYNIYKLPPHIPSEASLHYHSDVDMWVLSSMKLYDMYFTICYIPGLDLTLDSMEHVGPGSGDGNRGNSDSSDSSGTSNSNSKWKCVFDDYTAIQPPWDRSGLYNVYAGQSHPELVPFVPNSDPDPVSGSGGGSSSGRVSDTSIPTSITTNTTTATTATAYVHKISTVLTYVPNPLAGPGALMDLKEFESYSPKFVNTRVILD